MLAAKLLPLLMSGGLLDEVDAENVQRKFSLEGYRQDSSQHDAFRILPFVGRPTRVYESAADFAFESEFCGIGGEQWIELIQLLVEPYFWEYGTGSMTEVGDEHSSWLTVHAPEEIQSEIEALVAWFGPRVLAVQEVEIRVYEGASFRDLPIAQDLGGAGLERSRPLGLLSISLPANAIGTSRDVNPRNAVVDWEVEIADHAAVADPIVVSLAPGLDAALRMSPHPGGTYVDLLVKFSEARADVPPKVLQSTLYLDGQQGVQQPVSVSSVDHPCLAFSTFGGSFLIPAGKMLALPVSFETSRGAKAYLFEIRPKSPVHGFLAQMPVQHGQWPVPDISEEERMDYERERILTIFHPGAITSGGIQPLAIPAEEITNDTASFFLEEMTWAFPSFNSSPWNADVIHEQLDSALAPHQEQDSRLLLNALTTPFWALTSEPAAEFLSSLAEAMADLGPRYEIAGAIHSDSGRELGRFRLPALLDRPVMVWGGDEQHVVADWDVDVANGASIANPEMAMVLDGFGVNMELVPTAEGGLSVRMFAHIHALDAPPQLVSYGTSMNLKIDRTTGHLLRIDDSRVLPKEGGELEWSGSSVKLKLKITRS